MGLKPRAMPAEKQLRYPFKVAAKAGSFVSTKVTTGVDTTYDYTMKAFDGVKQNKYTTMVTKSITAFEKDVVSKTKPYATKAKPYIAPVVPYIEKAKPYAPKLALAAAVAVTIPMLFMFFFMSAITFPIWGFFALITSFIWVPAAFVATLVFGTVASFVAVVSAITYFSKPTGRAILFKYWKKISSTPLGSKILTARCLPCTLYLPHLHI